MRIAFYIPSEKQRVGGLDLAIRTLQGALTESGSEIAIEPVNFTGFDIVHFHGLWQRQFPKLACSCRRRGIPYVVSPHGMLEPWAWRHKWWKKWPYFFLLERAFLDSAAGLLAASATERQHLERFRFRPTITEISYVPPTSPFSLGLPKEIDLNYRGARRLLNWSDQEFVLLFLSRIHPKKGLHLLLSALIGLGESVPGLRLVVVGDGESAYLSRLHRFIKQNSEHLPPVEFLGSIWGDAKWKYFQAADLFCLPTYSENFGLAILESCQVGTPVLTTTGTPWTKFLTSHGFPVAEPKPSSVAAALKEHLALAKMPLEKRLALAESTHRQFSWASISQSYLNFYRTIALQTDRLSRK